MRLGTLLALLILGCDDRPEPTRPAVIVPNEYQHHGEELAAVGDATMSSIFVYDDSIADGTPSAPFGAPHLFITRGESTDHGYVASALAIGVVASGVFSSSWRITTTCAGTASYADATWTIALSGDPACTQWNGTFRARPSWVDSWDDPRLTAAAEPASVAVDPPLSLVLPPPTTDFARALVGLDAITPSDAPCAIALHAPDVETTSGDRPGEAALQHAGEGGGETFEVIDATSGETLPSAPESPARYQALFVRVVHRDPVVSDGAFDPGVARGRAFLVDTVQGRVVCVGDVAAENGTGIQARDEAGARMWLTIQLQLAEERAIALGLHAIAQAP